VALVKAALLMLAAVAAMAAGTVRNWPVRTLPLFESMDVAAALNSPTCRARACRGHPAGRR
jgi:hypothetical protein